MSRISEIELRLKEIGSLVESEDANIEELNKETDALIEERKALLEEEEKRQALLKDIAEGTKGTGKEVTKMEETRTFAIDSKEYRNAYLNVLKGTATEEEKRAFDTTNGAIALETANKIIDVVKNHAPLLEKCQVFRSGANITVYVEGVNAEGATHTEGAAITAAFDTLVPITLTPAEIVKQVKVSGAAMAMSVDAFEAWLTKTLGEAIARKINGIIVGLFANASGSQTTITAATVQELLGSVKGNANIICSQATLFQGLLPLQNNAGDVIKFNGTTAYVYGREVLVDDHVTDGTVYCADLSKVVCGMAEDITVKGGYDTATNSYVFNGVSLFDAKLGVAAAGKIVATL